MVQGHIIGIQTQINSFHCLIELMKKKEGWQYRCIRFSLYRLGEAKEAKQNAQGLDMRSQMERAESDHLKRSKPEHTV